MSCSKSIAAYLSSKIDFFMMFQKSADKILEKHRKICSKRLFEKSQPNFEYKNYIYGSIILFDNSELSFFILKIQIEGPEPY